MSGLGSAIRLRRRALDALALRLAGEQAAARLLEAEADELHQRRTAERLQNAAACPAAADAWFAQASHRLLGLADAKRAADHRLEALRHEAVQTRASLQLLEEAEAELRRADRCRRLAKAQAALDDRTASLWCRQ